MIMIFWPLISQVFDQVFLWPQLLSITNEIYKAFDSSPSLDVREFFLNLSKAFDRIWHDGLMYKLKLAMDAKRFADDTSLYSIFHYSTASSVSLNDEYLTNWRGYLT